LYGKNNGSVTTTMIDVSVQEGVTDPDCGAELYAIELLDGLKYKYKFLSNDNRSPKGLGEQPHRVLV
jgi:hypothetical protein